MVLGDSLSAFGIVVYPAMLNAGEAQIWQICVGVTVSSVFASLLEPAYKSTITDLLTAEQFSKASGAGAIGRLRKVSCYPLFWQDSFWDCRHTPLLIIDICTFFRPSLPPLLFEKGWQTEAFLFLVLWLPNYGKDLEVLRRRKAFLLAAMGSAITFCLGVVQTLASPMVLSFSNSTVLGND